jgi:shikimate 5-dehydrogenase
MLAGMAEELNASAQLAGSADLLLHKGDKWRGYQTLFTAAVQALTAVLQPKFGDHPISSRMIAIVGVNGTARALAQELQKLGASIILTSHQKKAGAEAAHALGCRFIQFEGLYSTMHDVLIVCDTEKDQGPSKAGGGVHAGYLKPGMTVFDLTSTLRDTELTAAAAGRQCQVVHGLDLLLEQLALQAEKLTSKEVPMPVLKEALPTWLTEAE